MHEPRVQGWFWRGADGRDRKQLERICRSLLRPPFALTLEGQQAIIAFAERSASLTGERSEELAQLSGPLVEGAAQPVERLYGMAKWLMGSRKAGK